MVPKPGSTPTRERILAYLEEHRIASVKTLSRSWRLTPADIRYHLGALIEEGLVERVPRDQDQPAKRGRPAQFYRISTKASQNNFPSLCSALLAVLLQGSAPTEVNRILRMVAAQLAGTQQTGQGTSALPVQRLNRSIDFLAQHGYRARWEASPSGPRVLFRGCPYAAIIEQHPELCRLDRFLLEALTDLPFQQTARMNPQTGIPPACIFLNRQNGQPEES